MNADIVRIRNARPEDLPVVLALIHELAAHSGAPDAVEVTVQELREHLFSASPAVFAHVAETADGEVVAFALWYLSFSTWTGRHGIHLEDLYVRPSHRGAGLGTRLMAELAEVCRERGLRRLEWWVHEENAGAAAFYRALGAEVQNEWTTYRLSGEALGRLGGGV